MDQLTLFDTATATAPEPVLAQESRETTSAREALHSSQSVEWYTPSEYLQAVRQVLGGIDLDPASCELANRAVRAERYYDITTDGLSRSWPGRVFLNPPYGKTEDGQSNQALWSGRLIEQYAAGITSEAILLVNAATGDLWFQSLWQGLPASSPICFTRRIKFYTPEGQPSQPTHGNAFIYLGRRPERFIRAFSAFGIIAARAA